MYRLIWPSILALNILSSYFGDVSVLSQLTDKIEVELPALSWLNKLVQMKARAVWCTDVKKKKKKRIKRKPMSFCFVLFFTTMSVISSRHAVSQIVHDAVEAKKRIKKWKGKLLCKKVFLISISETSNITFSQSPINHILLPASNIFIWL